MKYEVDQLNELQRDLSLESDRFIDEFRDQYSDEIIEVGEAISNLRSKFNKFKENYVEEVEDDS